MIRLNHPPTSEFVERLNRDFADILLDGEIRHTEPLPGEADDAGTLHLHRLLLRFNRQDFARLREMIDAINGMAS